MCRNSNFVLFLPMKKLDTLEKLHKLTQNRFSLLKQLTTFVAFLLLSACTLNLVQIFGLALIELVSDAWS